MWLKLFLISLVWCSVANATTISPPFQNYRFSQVASCQSITNGVKQDLCEQLDGTLWGCLQATCTTNQWTQLASSSSNIGNGTPGQEAVYIGTTSIGSGIITDTGSAIGISSVNPTQALDVQGTVKSTAFIKSGGTSSQFLKADGTTDSTSYGTGTVNNGTNFDLAYYNGTGTAVSGDSNVFTNGTNIGIGTYIFNNALDIVGGVGIGIVGTDQFITTTIPPGNLSIEGNVGIGTVFTTGGAALTVMNGNVGVGTWGPEDIIQFGNHANKFTISSSGNISAVGGDSNAQFTKIALNLNNPGGQVTIGNISSTAGSSTRIKGSSAQNSFLEIRATSGIGIGTEYIPFTEGSNGGIEAMRIFDNGPGNNGPNSFPTPAIGIGTTMGNGGLMIMNGNVGIGTWNPTKLISTNGSLFTVDNTGLMTSVGATIGLNALKWSNTEFIQPGGNIQQFKSTQSLGDQFFLNSIERIVFDANGNVGIGTSMILPTNKLAVGGGGIGIGTNASSAYVVINTAPLGGIIAEGNVGIGTWVPTKTLDVIGNIRASGTINASNNSFSATNISVSGDGVPFSINASNGGGNFQFQNGGSTKMLISSTGNVGISSASPGQLLDVQGTVRTKFFTMSGQTPATNYILSSTDSAGDATWSSIAHGASYQVDYQPGLLSAVNSTTGVYGKIVNTSTVDNIIGSALTFSCVSNPTVTMYECGTSTTCAAPTTIGTVTVQASGTAYVGTVSNSAVTAGDYIGFATTAGTCASIDIAVTAQLHTN